MAGPDSTTPEPRTVLQTDEVHDLIRAARSGDDEAKRALVAEAMAYVHPIIMSLLHQRRASGTYLSDTLESQGQHLQRVIEEDAWDLTHATCVAMLGSLGSFRGRNAFGRRVQFTTWLYAIARNQVRSAMRSRWRERRRRYTGTRSDNGDESPRLTQLVDESRPLPDETVLDQADVAAVRQALEQAPLTPEQRDAVVMFVVLGYKQDRIAELTGVQVGTVKKRIFDGLRKLRRYMQDLEQADRHVGGDLR